MNEKENLTPNQDGNEEGNEEGKAEKAFAWDWTDSESHNAETASPEAPMPESANTDTETQGSGVSEGDRSDDTIDENNASDVAEPQDEAADEAMTASDMATVNFENVANEITEIREIATNEARGKRKKEKKSRDHRLGALLAACILSACAISSLLTLSFALILGIASPNKSVNVQLSSGKPPSQEIIATSDMLEGFMESVVVIEGEDGLTGSTGTGVIMSDDGYIITNYHVIENMTKVTVYLYGSSEPYIAEVIGYKSVDDVAVIKINRTGLSEATFAKSAECRLGETVYAVGTPEGADFGWSVARGIISHPDRDLRLYGNDGILTKKMNVIQTDAPLNHGNSGGPLINTRGEVIGIVTLKLSSSAGIGFALPSDGVLIDAIAIIENGNADGVDSGIAKGRPLLGVTGVGVKGGTWYETVTEITGSSIREVTKEYAELYPLTTFYASVDGVRVSATTQGLDASGKLKYGDIITEINGIAVTDIFSVMDIINDQNGGDTVNIRFYRDGEYYATDVTLGEEELK